MNTRMMLAAAVVLVAAQAGRADFLYVTESNGTVVRYDTSSPTNAPTTVVSGLTNPASLAFDRSGDLFIASQSAPSVFIKQDEILRYTPGGSLTTFASNLNFIQGLATDATGNLFASSAGTSSILKFSPGGAVSTFATNLVGPTGLATDAASNLYVSINANQNRVAKITPAGSVSTYALGVSNPLGLAFDPSGNLYIANPGFLDIVKVMPGGAQSFIPLGESVTGVAVDSAGNLFFTAGGASSGIIGEITTAGTVSTFATTSSVPKYLTFAPAAVPEPSSLALTAVGLIALATAGGHARSPRRTCSG